jgi:predicted deacetylase
VRGPLTDGKALCVSIHDVAPPTWPDCLRLLRAVRAVADIPLTWLVVPRYHGRAAKSAAYEAMLGDLLAQGHELALHGYTHLDTATRDAGLRGRFLRTAYTQGEGEFAALGAAEARRRLELGLAWFRQRKWPVTGFVAPAWLLSGASWQVLREYPFDYTTTLCYFHLLPRAQAVFSPSVVYATRNAAARVLTRYGASLLAASLQPLPLIRLSLHPRDARHPALVRHFQGLLETFLVSRPALTKASFARHCAQLSA